MLLDQLLYLAGLKVHPQVSLLNDIHHLANNLYYHHYNSRIISREALQN